MITFPPCQRHSSCDCQIEERIQGSRLSHDGGGLCVPWWHRGGTCDLNQRVRDNYLERYQGSRGRKGEDPSPWHMGTQVKPKSRGARAWAQNLGCPRGPGEKERTCPAPSVHFVLNTMRSHHRGMTRWIWRSEKDRSEGVTGEQGAN